MKMTREYIANLWGDFLWDFGTNFLIETDSGNFIWSDPDYGGDNTIRQFSGVIKDFLGSAPFGRDKGSHIIGDYCKDFTFVNEEN